jgi:hypothetical protein
MQHAHPAVWPKKVAEIGRAMCYFLPCAITRPLFDILKKPTREKSDQKVR